MNVGVRQYMATGVAYAPKLSCMSVPPSCPLRDPLWKERRSACPRHHKHHKQPRVRVRRTASQPQTISLNAVEAPKANVYDRWRRLRIEATTTLATHQRGEGLGTTYLKEVL